MRERWFLEPASRGIDSYVVVENDDGYISLKIADCDHSVTLWFYDRTKEDRTVARKKLERLRIAIDILEQEIEKSIIEREAKLELEIEDDS